MLRMSVVNANCLSTPAGVGGLRWSYLDELFSVAGKTALVTGAATGIGRMAATALVKAGAERDDRFAQGRRLRQGRPPNSTRSARAGKAEGFAGDVCSEAGVPALAAEVKARTDTPRHPDQQCRHLLGRAAGDLPLSGLGQGAERQRHRGLST